MSLLKQAKPLRSLDTSGDKQQTFFDKNEFSPGTAIELNIDNTVIADPIKILDTQDFKTGESIDHRALIEENFRDIIASWIGY